MKKFLACTLATVVLFAGFASAKERNSIADHNVVTIGSQTWMTSNLYYNTGNSWCYENDPDNCETYGRLYDWETALTVCPLGSHLPSDDEWKLLDKAISDNGYDVHRFFYEDAGVYLGNNNFKFKGVFARLWTATKSSNGYALTRNIWNRDAKISVLGFDMTLGASVRCIMD